MKYTVEQSVELRTVLLIALDTLCVNEDRFVNIKEVTEKVIELLKVKTDSLIDAASETTESFTHRVGMCLSKHYGAKIYNIKRKRNEDTRKTGGSYFYYYKTA